MPKSTAPQKVKLEVRRIKIMAQVRGNGGVGDGKTAAQLAKEARGDAYCA